MKIHIVYPDYEDLSSLAVSQLLADLDYRMTSALGDMLQNGANTSLVTGYDEARRCFFDHAWRILQEQGPYHAVNQQHSLAGLERALVESLAEMKKLFGDIHARPSDIQGERILDQARLLNDASSIEKERVKSMGEEELVEYHLENAALHYQAMQEFYGDDWPRDTDGGILSSAWPGDDGDACQAEPIDLLSFYKGWRNFMRLAAMEAVPRYLSVLKRPPQGPSFGQSFSP